MTAADYPPPSAPYAVAQQLYRKHLSDEGLSHLAAWRGGWMAWQQTRWIEVDAAALRQSIYAALSQAKYWHETKTTAEWRPWNPDKHKMANVLEALAAVVHLSSDTDAPAWINNVHSAKQTQMISAAPEIDVTQTSAAQMISCNNGLLDLSTRRLHDHTPAFFNLVSVPFDYRIDAAEPAEWLKFLTSVWGDDDDSIMLLQEYFGYVLSGRMDMQKMLMLHRPDPLRQGHHRADPGCVDGRQPQHRLGPTLASLSTNFGLVPLIGKPLAFISDARLGNIPSHTVVERLLSITGEDWLTIDRKYREPWTGKLPTTIRDPDQRAAQVPRQLRRDRHPAADPEDDQQLPRPRGPHALRQAAARAGRHPGLGAGRAGPAHPQRPFHRAAVFARQRGADDGPGVARCRRSCGSVACVTRTRGSVATTCTPRGKPGARTTVTRPEQSPPSGETCARWCLR